MLNKKHLCFELGVSIPTIDRYMKKGMPYIKTPTGRVRFELEAVLYWYRNDRRGGV